MNLLKRNAFLSLFLLGAFLMPMTAQNEVIQLKNPSFEGEPRAGGSVYGISATGWIDCGGIMFPRETPPDIHPGNFFNVRKQAHDGRTYIGLVARENESWESVSQLLAEPMKEGNCYSINLYLSRSEHYVNRQPISANDDVKPQTNALVLRVYGGLRPCDKKQILAESELVTHTDWRNYKFDFKIQSNIYYITFEAFYKTPVLLPYNGNLLIDNISDITQIQCPNEPIVVAETAVPAPVKVEKVIKAAPPKPKEEEKTVISPPKKEKVITQELNTETLVAGQTIEINKLYFAADTSSINNDSHAALDEVYDFLKENPLVRIEIGGHTNDIPADDYCDKLSSARAKSVAQYLIRKGIPASRVEFRGYGKRKPIASNKSKEGRKRNQRVEITILNIN